MYTLIGSLKTRAIRVAWMLEELGQPYTVDAIRPRDPAVTALNPSGKVPILKDGPDAIVDSTAIIQYLADKHGALTFKAGTIARAHQDSFTQFALDEVDGPLWTAAKHTFALPEVVRVEAVKPACKFECDRAFTILAARLGDHKYVMGDTFTVPDIILGHCLGWSKTMGWAIPDGPVAAYTERVMARPAAVRAYAKRA